MNMNNSQLNLSQTSQNSQNISNQNSISNQLTNSQRAQRQRQMFIPQQQNKMVDPNMFAMRRSNINTTGQYYIPQNMNNNSVNYNKVPQIFNSNTPRGSNQKPLDILVFQLSEKVQKISKLVDKHQQQFSNLNQQAKFDQTYQFIMKKLESSNTFKKIIANSTSELHQYVFNFKMDIKSLRDQISLCLRKQQFSGQLLKNEELNSLVSSQHQQNTQQSSPNKASKRSLSTSPRKQNNSNVSMQLISDIEAQIAKNHDYSLDLIQKLEKQMNNMQKSIQKFNNQIQVKPGPMKSIVTPIMIEYKQFFTVTLERQQLDVPINKTVYFLDKQGYLLDADSRYLLKHNGKRIQLQQKHRQLLKKNNILITESS